MSPVLADSFRLPTVGNVDGMNPIRSIDPTQPDGFRWLRRPDMDDSEDDKSKARL